MDSLHPPYIYPYYETQQLWFIMNLGAQFCLELKNYIKKSQKKDPTSSSKGFAISISTLEGKEQN